MEKLGDVYIDLNQNEANIDDVNLNAIWVDLDKGLLSDNIGQQCEFVVKLTELFDKFPLPVFVNSGFLRLAKIFQNGNNYLKLQVIRVIEKNQKHLQKILSIDEICRLIFHNIHSNDAICRALTLRALADISVIISDRHNVQHSVRLALESHDELEVKEAIYAADKFCSVSKSFAASLFGRISEMIEDIQSPLNRKLQLVPLLIHMHHDTILSAKAKNLCKAMYYSFPRADISKIILNTLTLIACKSLTNIFETVGFFLNLLQEEPREKIHLILLKNLDYLARKLSHLWKIDNINSLLSYISDHKENDLLAVKASKILCSLIINKNVHFYFVIESSMVPELDLNPNELENQKIDVKNLKAILDSMIFHTNKSMAFNFCLFSTNILVYQHETHQNASDGIESKVKIDGHSVDKEYLFEITKNGLFSIILQSDTEMNENMENESFKETQIILKKSLKCTIDLVILKNENYIEELNTFIASLLNSIGANTAEFYCDTLLTLCRFDDFNSTKSTKEISMPKFLRNVFIKLVEKQKESNSSNLELQLKLINLLFELQVRTNKITQEEHLDNENSELVKKCVREFLDANEKNQWLKFKLARMCVRYSYYELATKLFNNVSNELRREYSTNVKKSDIGFISWLEFMALISKAEFLISQTGVENINDYIQNLNESLSLYINAQILFKANCARCFIPFGSGSGASTSSGSSSGSGSSSTSYPPPTLENSDTSIQIRYCELRAEQIKLFIHMVLSTMTYQTIPPPAFQFKSSENFGKLGRIAQQMKNSMVELQKLNQKVKELISECFDGDIHTLNVLNIFKKHNECLIFCINLLSSPKSEEILTEEYLERFLGKNYYNASRDTTDKTLNCVDNKSAELKIMEIFYTNLLKKVKLLAKQDSTSNAKINQVKQFQNILIGFIRLPMTLPRAFFNAMQKTEIKLIIHPNIKKSNNLIAIRNDQNLVVKIDGIISQFYKGLEPIRTVKKIQVCLTIDLDIKSTGDVKFLPNKYTDIKTSLEDPKNDYFGCNMLVNFPYCGNYTILVDIYIVDSMDVVWHYLAEKHQMLVKVEEDPVRQKLFAALAAAATSSNNNTAPPVSSAQAFNSHRALPNHEMNDHMEIKMEH